MTNYNILILSAGRRVELVEAFKKAAQRLDIKNTVVASDCSKTAPALYFADEKVLLPRIDNENYIDEIIKISKEKEIALIIPTIDTDLLILSKEKDRIYKESRAKVLISDESIISICRNKIKSQEFFEDNDFKIARLYKEEELKDERNLNFPLFIKPKSGSSSINTFKVDSYSQLKTYMKLIEDYVVQDFIDGEEYTIDSFLDFDSGIITIVPRLRMAVRSGEISKGRIVKDREIIDEIKRLLNVLKPIGHITIQLMKTKRGIEFIEINPRFGGGAPMSIDSGADSCENLYRLLKGEKLDYNEDYKDNINYLRFDNSICIDDNGKLIKND